MSIVKRSLKVLAGFFLLVGLLTWLHFPRDKGDRRDETSRPSATETKTAETFYDEAYTARDSDEDPEYVLAALQAAESHNLKGQIADFVERFKLQDKKVLDVGAGSGYLQDMVDDYTGLDIAPERRALLS